MSHARDEVEAAVTRLIKLRDRVSDGDGCWADLAPMFTDDVVYIDPAWGRIEGIEAVRAEVLGEAMDGLDWRFPTDLYLIDGDNLRHGLNADLGFSPADRDENVPSPRATRRVSPSVEAMAVNTCVPIGLPGSRIVTGRSTTGWRAWRM